MDSQSKASCPEILPQVAGFFNVSAKPDAVTKAMIWLSSFYERPMSDETIVAYLSVLQELSPLQLQIGFSHAARECRFFPPPAELRALAGCRTVRQCFEDEAREGLRWILEMIKIHGRNLQPKQGRKLVEEFRDEEGIWHRTEYELIPCPPATERLKETVRLLGGGDTSAGRAILARHPTICEEDRNQYGSFGEMQRTVEQFERRWIRLWEQAGQETALEVAA